MAVLLVSGCGGDGSGPVLGPAPTISAVSPATGTVGTELTITGTNFRAGLDVFVGSFASDSVDGASGAQVFARAPIGVVAGQSYTVRVRNADATEAQRAAAFTAVAPTLQFVNGATQPSGNVGSTVILEGLAFGDEQGTGRVLFSDGAGGTIPAVIADPLSDWTNSFIVTTVPSGAASGDVVVLTGTGTSNALTFTMTTEAAFSPSTISWTQTTSLPIGLSGHRAVFAAVGASNLVYVLGGADSTYAPRDSVYYAAIQSGGQLSTWTAAASMPGAGRSMRWSLRRRSTRGCKATATSTPWAARRMRLERRRAPSIVARSRRTAASAPGPASGRSPPPCTRSAPSSSVARSTSAAARGPATFPLPRCTARALTRSASWGRGRRWPPSRDRGAITPGRRSAGTSTPSAVTRVP